MMSIRDKIKMLLAGCSSGRLPAGYTELVYIQSAGTQWIDTGYKPTSETKIDFEWMDCNSVAKSVGVLDNNAVKGQPQFGVSTAGTGTKWCLHYGTDEVISGSYSRNVKYHIVQDKNELYVDGVLVCSMPKSTYSTTINMYMFCENVDNVASAIGIERFYSAKIYESDVLVRNFITCLSPSGEVGMYDTVEGKFYTNQGTGTFIAGPEVN